jgi:hypothetical protein
MNRRRWPLVVGEMMRGKRGMRGKSGLIGPGMGSITGVARYNSRAPSALSRFAGRWSVNDPSTWTVNPWGIMMVFAYIDSDWDRSWLEGC